MFRDEQDSKRTASHRQAGNRAEQVAARYLGRQGLQLLFSNYYCRAGEIDLVAKDAGTLVFVEVRLRNNPTRGTAVETVTLAKQQKIIHCARYFLMKNPGFSAYPCRFDVLGISTTRSGDYQFDWIRNAFQPVI